MKEVAALLTKKADRRWRLVKWGAVRALRPLFKKSGLLRDDLLEDVLGPFQEQKPLPLVFNEGDVAFSPRTVLHGAIADKVLCTAGRNLLWVSAESGGECIRYFPAGLAEGPNPLVMIYLAGDVMTRDHSGRRRIVSAYAEQTPARLSAAMQAWSSEAGVPAIYLARPGMYGSSGDHNRRRSFYELNVIDAAIDELRTRYSIKQFVLVGHSGGGQVVAGLISERSDLAGVVISSGLLSVHQVVSSWEFKREIPGRYLYDSTEYYDPLAMIADIRQGGAPPVYILSDPEDQAVPFYSQLRYARRLRAAGVSVQHIFLHGPKPAHHLLGEQAKRAAVLLVNDRSALDIRRDLQKANIEVVGEARRLNGSSLLRSTIPPLLAAKSAICIGDNREGCGNRSVLFSKNPDTLVPPASLVKILTAMIAIDCAEVMKFDLDHEIVIGSEDISSGSGGNIFPGEAITLRDAIVNLLLPSSNTTANAVCRHFDNLLLDGKGCGKSFVDLMSGKLKMLGALSTKVQNPSGIASRGQVTTARDMASIVWAASQYDAISSVWSLANAGICARDKTIRKIDVTSTVGIVRDYDFVGGKTGTLVPGVFNIAAITLAPDGSRMVAVILGAQSDSDRVTDIRDMVDYVKRSYAWSLQ